MNASIPSDVRDLIDAFVEGVRAALGPNLVGVYLKGSLVVGDFRPDTSDVDLLVATACPVGPVDAEALFALDARIAGLANPYARRYEVAYIDLAALRRFEPGTSHLTLGQGEALRWTHHRENRILERWSLREHGVAVFGPPAETLVDPISRDDLLVAVRRELESWADWAVREDDPDWSHHLGHKAYVVETTCRMPHTLTTGEISGKPQAVAWAAAALPASWPSLVERSRAWLNSRAKDPSVNPDVRAFVLWADGRADPFQPASVLGWKPVRKSPLT